MLVNYSHVYVPTEVTNGKSTPSTADREHGKG